MFTGIVEETGRIAEFARGTNAWTLRIEARAVLENLAIGDSIAVNGCCLTAAGFDQQHLWFDVLEETRRLTNFKRLGAGGRVNLERSLRFDGKVGGHFVSGHIDGVGLIEVLEQRGDDTFLTVGAAPGSGRYLIHKGSIAIDGISLTVAETEHDRFSVWLIPHTLAVTTLGARKVGDEVNLEFDLLGKYVEKLLQRRA
jgi:riboflavin synthase